MGEAVTQLRKRPDAISNYFDELERGIGPRGSTFTDIDAIRHDIETKRFLITEFKQPGERMDKAQWWVYRDLAGLPRCTVWLLRVLSDGNIEFFHVGVSKKKEIVTRHEYRCRLADWWRVPRPEVPTVAEMVTADQIPWAVGSTARVGTAR